MATWQPGEIPHVQNDTFQRSGYMPLCELSCAGNISDPEQAHAITYQKTTTEGNGADRVKIVGTVTEPLHEGRMFVKARSIELGLKVFQFTDDDQPFLDTIPEHVSSAASECAAKIREGKCGKYIVSEGTLRLKKT